MTNRVRAAAPFAALLSMVITALAFAAQAGLAFCNRRLTFPMPADMSMPAALSMPSAMPGLTVRGLMICPVVLILIVASALLAVAAIVIANRDMHRRVTLRASLRTLAHLPLERTVIRLGIGTGCAVAAMLVADGNGPPPFLTCVAMLGFVIAGAFVAATLSVIAGRVALALGERLMLAILRPIVRARTNAAAVRRRRVTFAAGVVRWFARTYGMRAPPLTLR